VIHNPRSRRCLLLTDDLAIRQALSSLIRSAKLAWRRSPLQRSFCDAAPRDPRLPCARHRLPDLNGLDLQQHLIRKDVDLPIIFITGHGDIPTSVRAIKAGALEFLTKPFRKRDLLRAIKHAIERDREALIHRREIVELTASYDSLTPREQEVMRAVVKGLPINTSPRSWALPKLPSRFSVAG